MLSCIFKSATIRAPVLGNLTSWVHSNRNRLSLAWHRGFHLYVYDVFVVVASYPVRPNEERIDNLEWHLIIAICELKMINTGK